MPKNTAKPRNTETKRPKIMCPISGYRGNVTNLVRHLSHCHNYLTKEEEQEVFRLKGKV